MATDTYNKVRTGDVIAVHRKHSYQSLKEGLKTYSDWTLALVHWADRDGRCRSFETKAGSKIMVDHARHQIFTLSPDRQADSRRIFDTMPRDRIWASGEDLKQAIREADTRE